MELERVKADRAHTAESIVRYVMSYAYECAWIPTLLIYCISVAFIFRVSVVSILSSLSKAQLNRNNNKMKRNKCHYPDMCCLLFSQVSRGAVEGGSSIYRRVDLIDEVRHLDTISYIVI